ncbi:MULTISPECIES: phage/plasmid primase, P4 family [Leptolyngbya]|uniref:phage/plasmid primase, P4 family n=1 Tax=Leptolyngbya TaxID=47251 RepID=UPI0016827586|nr:phage/plasmid primase, P4 family [Leptolyngbya sp. FACHB-1624]
MEADGIESISSEEARKRGIFCKGDDGKTVSPSGLWFPFGGDFGQIRADNPPIKNGEPVKYLTTCGKGSKAYLPVGAKVITEGWKDGFAGTVHGGIATGAIAGVSHYKKALPKGSKMTILFDADGWTNPSVLLNLFNAAMWTGGKIQLVPQIPGEPKAGLCEYFKAGYTAEDYKVLIDSAMNPRAFLMKLSGQWGSLEGDIEKKWRCIKVVLNLAAKHLNRGEQTSLIDAIDKTFEEAQKQSLKSMLSNFRKRIEAQQNREKKKRRELERKEKEAQRQERIARDYPGYPLIPVEYDDNGIKLPREGSVANILYESYRHTWSWIPAQKTFYRYGKESDGLWSEMALELAYRQIQKILDGANDFDGAYNDRYITSICNLLRNLVTDDKWEESKGLLPFKNGVLNLDTGELLPHSPIYRFTWQMPREHDLSAKDYPEIDKWFSEATQGDNHAKRLLICFCAAVLRGMNKIQKFLNVTGRPGSGKGTFTRLLQALIGERNVYATDLDRLAVNQFDLANARNKRLMVFNDSEKTESKSALRAFKNLTGEDRVVAEVKCQQASNFVFEGLILVSSNHPVFPGDQAIDRRQVVVPFDLVVKEPDPNLGKKFESELSAFTNALLEIPEEVIIRTLQQVDGTSEAIADKTWDYKIRTNSVLHWLDECVVMDENSRIPVGSKIGDLDTAYGNYHDFCIKSGSKPKSGKEFAEYIGEILGTNKTQGSIVKLPVVFKKKMSSGMVLHGVKFKSPGSDELSLIATVREQELSSKKIEQIDETEDFSHGSDEETQSSGFDRGLMMQQVYGYVGECDDAIPIDVEAQAIEIVTGILDSYGQPDFKNKLIGLGKFPEQIRKVAKPKLKELALPHVYEEIRAIRRQWKKDQEVA